MDLLCNAVFVQKIALQLFIAMSDSWAGVMHTCYFHGT